MSYTITNTKDNAVTLGVMDQNLRVEPDLQQVTFTDHNDTPHTVHAHKNGPFGDAEGIVKAWADGTLHAFESHDVAAQYAEDHGDHEGAKRLRALNSERDNAHADQSGGLY